jgi:murein DD-endopeptidase MepM/ murein hydrolase activator NlpD
MLCLLFMPLTSAWGEPSAPSEGEVVLHVQGAARQGGVLFVTVEGRTEGSLTWLGATYPLAAEDGKGRAILPVPVETKPGAHSLVLAEGPARTVRIASTRFPHQSITLPPAMLAGYDNPRNKSDDQLLIDAARVFTPIRYWRGAFLQPAEGPIGTHFGQKRTYNGWRKGWHKGLDIEAWGGSAIRAPGAAVVAVTAPHQLVNGNATLLNHGMGVYSLYMHQSRIRVKKGQEVARGRRIGDVGATGAGTGPHLHWQVFVHGIPVDPVVFMHPPAGW